MSNTLIRRSGRPLVETSGNFGDLDRMMAGFFRPVGNMTTTGTESWVPAVDIKETEDAFVLEAELAGLSKDDVSVTLDDGVLTLSGERTLNEETEDDNYRRIERRHGSFSRSFNLGSQVDGDKVTATFGNGILTIEVPKLDEIKPRSIEIQ